MNCLGKTRLQPCAKAQDMDHGNPDSVNEWTWETIEGLADQREGQYLEFKERLGDDTEERRNIEREITAFANASGGIVVFGVTDDGTSKPMPRPENEIEQTVVQLIQNATPLPNIDISDPLEPPSDDTDRVALAVRVYEAGRKPILTSDSAVYMRINDRKEPMSREQMESLFVEHNRKQQAVRQLEMEIDRFHEAVHGERGLRIHDEAPPDYHLLNLESLKEVLRNSPHLYAQEEARRHIQRIFEELLWLDDREVYVGRVVSGVQSVSHMTQDQFYRKEREKLKVHAERLESRLGDLADTLNLDVEVDTD